MIRHVQYLRGIAAMMVVWFHAVTQVSGTERFIPFAHFGAFGVDIFFAISGFIMLVTTWDKAVTPIQFMRARVKRIVPLYWLATLLMVGLAIAAPALFKTLKWDFHSLVKSLLFVPYFSLSFPDQVWPLLVPGWSLNYEMFFYVLFALALLLGRNWRVPVMVGTLAALVAGGMILHPTTAEWQAYTNFRLLEFGAGMIAGRLWVMRKHVRRDGGHPLLMALGDASYSIYLTHVFTLGVLRVLWVKVFLVASMGSSISLMGVSLVLCAAVGCGCFVFVERPITKRLNRTGRETTTTGASAFRTRS